MAAFFKIVEFNFFTPKETRPEILILGNKTETIYLLDIKTVKRSKNCDSPFVSADGYLWIDFVVI